MLIGCMTQFRPVCEFRSHMKARALMHQARAHPLREPTLAGDQQSN